MGHRFTFMDWLSGLLVTLGGINWGLMGFFKYDTLAHLFGDGTTWYRIIAAVVGLAALYIAGAVTYYATAGDHSHAAA